MKVVGRAVRLLPGGDAAINGAKAVRRHIRTRQLKRRHGQYAPLDCGGILVCVDLTDPTYHWYDGWSTNLSFDRRLFELLLPHMTGTLFVDVGAHFGYFSAMFHTELLRQRRDAHIVAIEPSPDAFECLKRTTRSHVLPTSRILAAVGNQNGTTTLYRGHGTCCQTFSEPGARPLGTVAIVSLEQVCSADGLSDRKIAFLKIDVDGYEPFVFAGAERLLARDRPFMLMEFVPSALERASAEPRRFFMQLCSDFFVYLLDYQSRTCHRLRDADYERLLTVTNGGIADLLLSPLALSDELAALRE